MMYAIQLNTTNAQKIADGIMKTVPYNINIMDNDGVIIASGDRDRINQIHQGAVKALHLKKPYVVYEDTDTEREGINLPIFYNQNIVGVIGISGSKDEVMQIGQIVVITAQLMIENQVFSDMAAIKDRCLKDFLYDWIIKDQSEYTVDFLDQANYFGINLSNSRTAVIFTINRIRYSVIAQIKRILEPNEYIVRQRMEDVLILFNSNKNLETKIEKVLSISNDLLNCYIGDPSVIASETTQSATKTHAIAVSMEIKKKMVYFHEVSLEYLLSKVDHVDETRNIIRKLEEKDADGTLRETIKAYVANTQNYGAVCKQLHIHRNTLNYRLAKIEELIGKDPRCARQLMILYIAIIKMETMS